MLNELDSYLQEAFGLQEMVEVLPAGDSKAVCLKLIDDIRHDIMQAEANKKHATVFTRYTKDIQTKISKIYDLI